MLSTTIFATLMAFAAAVPQGGPSVKTGDICGNGNQLYCCNDQSVTNKVTAGLLSDLDLRKILSSECAPALNLNVLLNQVVPIENKCRQQSICCGEQKQNGLVNLGCTPVTVL